MKNIGFYGQSEASWADWPIDGQTSFIDKIISHYNVSLACKGVAQGSEERALRDIKKTKKLDLAIIFHSNPRRLTIPQASRDIDVRDFDSNKAFYLWNENKNADSEIRQLKDDYFRYGGLKELFGDIETVLDTFTLYKKFLHDPDIHLNRFYGSLIQIDQYLTTKNIPALHMIESKYKPNWFNFTSGVDCSDVLELTKTHYEIRYPNNISAKGQDIVAEALIRHIDELTRCSTAG